VHLVHLMLLMLLGVPFCEVISYVFFQINFM
jgi:hypothetical protein